MGSHRRGWMVWTHSSKKGGPQWGEFHAPFYSSSDRREGSKVVSLCLKGDKVALCVPASQASLAPSRQVPRRGLGKQSRALVALALLARLSGGVAQADAQVAVHVAPIAAMPNAVVAVTPFDPTLGRLDKVRVFIQGVVFFTGLAPPNIIAGSPEPYTYDLEVVHNFFGLGDRYFAFVSPAGFSFTGPATGLGEAVGMQRSFSHSFTFDETSDLVGGVVPETSGAEFPPAFILGTRDRFLKTSVAPDVIQVMDFFIPLSAPAVVQGGFGSSGVMTIEYDFTPVSPAVAGPPKAQVTLSGSEFHVGQAVTVGIEAENQGGNPPADLYVGALLPDGQTLIFLSGPGVLVGPTSLATPAAFTRLQAVPPGFVLHAPALSQFTFPPTGVPVGTYQVFAGLARQGAFEDNRIDPDDILALDVKALVFSP